MSRWFRFYDDALNDPKVQLLSSDMFKAWVNLLCIASKGDGTIASIGSVAFALRLSESKAKATIAFLAGKGLLEENGNGGFRPHNWDGRQHKSDVSNERVKRYRQRNGNGECNVTSTVTVTPPDTEAETDTEAELKKETRASALAVGWPPDFRERFWSLYPNKVGRPHALKRLERVAKGGKVTFDAVMAGLGRYIASKPPDRPFCNPATWINQERWADEPAQVPRGPPSAPRAATFKDQQQQGLLDAVREANRYAEGSGGSDEIGGLLPATGLPARS